MSTATLPQPNKAAPSSSATEASAQQSTLFDPDSFRMSVGEHLEELRTRIILALAGFFVAIIICLVFSERVMVFFCAPLTHQLEKRFMDSRLYYSDLTDPFMTYLKISMISAAAIAGPWMIYQIWLFVAAGLYPHERKNITRYIPLSVILFLTGLVFVYFAVLPLCIGFFLDFGNLLPMPGAHSAPKVENVVTFHVPFVHGDPASLRAGDLWLDVDRHKLKIFFPESDTDLTKGTIRSLSFGSDSLVSPIITLGQYIDLVLMFGLIFGIAFQLPLVILAVVAIGIVDVAFLRKQRKAVFFGMTIASAFLAPGDIITSMMALLIPLVVLYEFGLWLAVFAGKKKVARQAAGAAENQA